jgi:hypothetical protein
MRNWFSKAITKAYILALAGICVFSQPAYAQVRVLKNDIGTPRAAGSVTLEEGRLSLSASSGDIWGSADNIFYVYAPLAGNGAIEATITGFNTTKEWAKVGLMVRESLNANSKMAFFQVGNPPASSGSQYGLVIQDRQGTGGAVTNRNSRMAPKGAIRLRLVRSGSTFSMSYRLPGTTTFSTLGSTTVSMATNGYIGIALAAKSGATGTIDTANAVLRNVRINGEAITLGGTTVPPTECTTPLANGLCSVKLGGSTGSVTVNSGTYTVTSNGADVWGGNDRVHFINKSVTGNTSVTVRVNRGLTNTGNWPKAGIMFRDNNNPDARSVFFFTNNSGWAQLQYRATVGATSVNAKYGQFSQGGARQLPGYLRVVRSNNNFSAYTSNDGSNFTLVDTVSVPLSSTAKVGIALTSGDATKTATASFTGLTFGGTVTPPGPTCGPNQYLDNGVCKCNPGYHKEGDVCVKDDEPVDPPPSGDRITVNFQNSSENFPNPERGFWRHGIDSQNIFNFNPGKLQEIKSRGSSLVFFYLKLGRASNGSYDYRNRDLDDRVLNQVRYIFSETRKAGLKAIPRFFYAWGGEADTDLNRVLQHMNRLAPIVQEYSDVIAVMQNGLIGNYGESYGSTNGLHNAGPRSAIRNKWLEILPTDRMMQMRYPYQIREDFNNSSLSESNWWNGSNQSRVGNYNDCVMSGSTFGRAPSSGVPYPNNPYSQDIGTWGSSSDYTHIINLGRYAPIGGETCEFAHGYYTDYNVGGFQRRFYNEGWDYLNGENGNLNNRMGSEGMATLSKSLGYRFRLISATGNREVRRGGTYGLTLRMRNDGSSGIYNPRDIELVFRNRSTGQNTRVEVPIGMDSRRYLPNSLEEKNLNANVVVPSSMAAGDYDVFLNLPDPYGTIRNRPEYSIRLANSGIWEASTGFNRIMGVRITN